MFSGCPSIHPVIILRPQFWLLRQHGQTDLIYWNVQPLWQKFFTKDQGQSQGQRFKKMFCLRDNLENNYCISPIFYVDLLMSMQMTWLDFQLSTDNQNGRQLANKFFFLLKYFFYNSQ